MTHTIETLVDAWQWTPKDEFLHTLPLNHVHGLTYGLLTSIYSGSSFKNSSSLLMFHLNLK